MTAFFKKRKALSKNIASGLGLAIIVAASFGYLFLYQPQTTNAAWFATGGTWLYRKEITIDHTLVAGNLTNFPVLISETDTDLRTTGNGGHVVSSTGGDILFTTSDGSTKLDHEIESYTASTGEIIAWVEIPSLSASTDTVIYMYYGSSVGTAQSNPTGVWDSNYKLVYHMEDLTLNTVEDSTTSGLDGTKTSNNDPLEDDGFIGLAQNFEDVGEDAVVIDDGAILDWEPSVDDRTFSLWWYPTALAPNGVGQWAFIRTVEVPGGTDRYSCGMEDLTFAGLGMVIACFIYDNGYNPQGAFYSPVSLSANTWYKVDLVVSTPGNTEVYLNGVSQTVIESGWTSGHSVTPTETSIKHSDHNGSGTGIVDEYRISDTLRSEDWIDTEYVNQSSPGTFYTVGSEEEEDDEPPPPPPPGPREYQVNNNGVLSTSTAGIRVGARGILPSTGWYATGGTWTYRKKISIDHRKVAGSLSNFPVLFSRTDPELRSTGNGGLVASTTAGAILFTSSDGTTKLDHEIESYDPATGSLVAWVEVPSLSSTADTDIYMYYGSSATTYQPNPTGVWDSDFSAVWHLKENPSSAGSSGILDSTSNAHHGTDGGGMDSSDQVAGKAGTGLAFDGDDYIQIDNSSGIELGSADWTFTGWVNVNNTGTTKAIFSKTTADSWTSDGKYFAVNSSEIPAFNTHGNATTILAPDPIPAGTWKHLAITLTEASETIEMFVDGVSVDVEPGYTIDPDVGTHVIRLGYRSSGTAMDGAMDEMHFSDIVRSDEWIATEYANQNDPNAFYAVGGSEAESRIDGTSESSAVRVRGNVKFR